MSDRAPTTTELAVAAASFDLLDARFRVRIRPRIPCSVQERFGTRGCRCFEVRSTLRQFDEISPSYRHRSQYRCQSQSQSQSLSQSQSPSPSPSPSQIPIHGNHASLAFSPHTPHISKATKMQKGSPNPKSGCARFLLPTDHHTTTHGHLFGQTC